MPLPLHSQSIERPLLASLLQLGWGVSSPDTAWSVAHNATFTDLLWATGLTPFGPYSTRTQLSFGLRDAAARAAIHSAVSEALDELAQLRDYFADFGRTIDEVLSPTQHLLFLQRLNVLTFKLRRANSYLSLQNFRYAQYYLHSIWHDTSSMRQLLEQAATSLQSNLVCSS